MHDISLIDRTLTHMGRRQYRSKGRGTYWASEASVKFTNSFGEEEVAGKCLRAVYYRLKGVEQTNPPNAKSQVIFLMGNMIEDQVCEMWKQMGIWENNSVRWEDKDHNLSGEYDIILREGDRFYGVEVKSFYGYHANKQILGHFSGRGSNKQFIPGRPKDEHLMQAAIYAAHTRGELEGFKLFYVSRDNNQFQEFNIKVDDDLNIYINGNLETRFTMADVYARYAELKRYDENNIMPPRDFVYAPDDARVEQLHARGDISDSAFKKHQERKEAYTDFHCSYCSYKDKCLGPTSETTGHEATEIAMPPDHILHGGL